MLLVSIKLTTIAVTNIFGILGVMAVEVVLLSHRQNPESGFMAVVLLDIQTGPPVGHYQAEVPPGVGPGP